MSLRALEGKRVFISGASRGLGRLIALYMAQQGCNLLLHSRSLEHTRALIGELSVYPVEVDAVAADLAQPQQLEGLLDTLASMHPAIDVVFNNAAVQVAYRNDYWRTPVEDFTTSMQVNLIAPAMICLRLLPSMQARGFGRIINVTSGIRDEPEQSGYAASKAALEKFTRDLATRLDGDDDVLMNLVDPGWCRTDLGGPQAPNDPASALPGMVLGAFVNDGRSGRLLQATDYAGMSLQQAVQKVEAMHDD
jgi:3-oxoacyl-[acyl-carrier protein] reductase